MVLNFTTYLAKKMLSFHSDVEESYSNAGGGVVPMLAGQQALPPIFMPVKEYLIQQSDKN